VKVEWAAMVEWAVMVGMEATANKNTDSFPYQTHPRMICDNYCIRSLYIIYLYLEDYLHCNEQGLVGLRIEYAFRPNDIPQHWLRNRNGSMVSHACMNLTIEVR
jgi:hypothetical protein